MYERGVYNSILREVTIVANYPYVFIELFLENLNKLTQNQALPLFRQGRN